MKTFFLKISDLRLTVFCKYLRRYVRCIKPNVTKEPNHYNEKLVLDQLKYLGMLDIIRIRKEGYPIHLPFHEFLSRYRCLVRKKLPDDERSAVKYVLHTIILNFNVNIYHCFFYEFRAFLALQNIPSEECQIGKTKVFLRNKAHEPLEDKQKMMLNLMATTIQRTWKGYFARKGILIKKFIFYIIFFSFKQIYLKSNVFFIFNIPVLKIYHSTYFSISCIQIYA